MDLQMAGTEINIHTLVITFLSHKYRGHEGTLRRPFS